MCVSFDDLCLPLLNAFLQGVERRSAAKIVYDPDPTNDANENLLDI